MINSVSKEDLEKIFTKVDPLASYVRERGQKTGYDDDVGYAICLSDIFSQLIQDAGRFCDKYASDMLFAIDEIKKAVADDYANEILLIGIRANGVDTTSFIADKLSHDHWQPYYYRRIYGVKIWHDLDNVFVEMRDVELAINTLCNKQDV